MFLFTFWGIGTSKKQIKCTNYIHIFHKFYFRFDYVPKAIKKHFEFNDYCNFPKLIKIFKTHTQFDEIVSNKYFIFPFYYRKLNEIFSYHNFCQHSPNGKKNNNHNIFLLNFLFANFCQSFIFFYPVFMKMYTKK